TWRACLDHVLPRWADQQWHDMSRLPPFVRPASHMSCCTPTSTESHVTLDATSLDLSRTLSSTPFTFQCSQLPSVNNQSPSYVTASQQDITQTSRANILGCLL